MHHVIIGGGPAAINAVETIRQFDGGRSVVTLVCDEPAHSRMALPYWLAGAIPEAQTHTGDAAYFTRLKVATRFGVRAASVDPQRNTVTLSDGSKLEFDNLLIATGSSPIAPSIPGADLPGVQPLWSLAHTDAVLKHVESLQPGRTPRVVLVGAGFIGFIVLNAMYKRKWQLAVVEREGQVLPRMLDAPAAGHVHRWLAARNIPVHCGATVRQIRQQADGTKAVELSDGQSLAADIVILATGIRPNLDLLQGSGIVSDEAILVNDRMQTNFAHVYAGGDVAQAPVLFGAGKEEVHPIQPTAVDHGRVAGANMAGQDVHYPGSLLMNVVDICGVQGVSFGRWNDAAGETTMIDNPSGFIYRKLLWTDDLISGAIFTGRANDLGMLTDVGMIKGLMQTQTRLGPWKKYLQANPFDIRRAYVASGVAAKLAGTTLLGQAAKARLFHFASAEPNVPANAAHAVFVART